METSPGPAARERRKPERQALALEKNAYGIIWKLLIVWYLEHIVGKQIGSLMRSHLVYDADVQQIPVRAGDGKEEGAIQCKIRFFQVGVLAGLG